MATAAVSVPHVNGSKAETNGSSQVNGHTPSVFSRSQMLQEFPVLCKKMNTVYSQEMVEKILTVYEAAFKDAVVIFRLTDRPGDAINFRFFTRGQFDCITPGLESGFLQRTDPLVKLTKEWSALPTAKHTEEWVDFHPTKGIAKIWIFYRWAEPIDNILSVPTLPASIRAHGPTLHSLGLEDIVFTATDFPGKSMNLYFLAPISLISTLEQARRYTALSGCPDSAFTQAEYDSMMSLYHGPVFVFAVTYSFATGDIPRVAFYALDVPHLPENTDPVITKFYEEVPVYDDRKFAILAWSYGKGGKKYMKGEANYIGEMATKTEETKGYWEAQLKEKAQKAQQQQQ